MVLVDFFHHPWSPPTTEPNEGTPGTGQSPACRVPRIHGWYIQAQSVLISAILIRLYTRIAPAICPLKGWHSHDQPIDQIGPSLATLLSQLRAKWCVATTRIPSSVLRVAAHGKRAAFFGRLLRPAEGGLPPILTPVGRGQSINANHAQFVYHTFKA